MATGIQFERLFAHTQNVESKFADAGLEQPKKVLIHEIAPAARSWHSDSLKLVDSYYGGDAIECINKLTQLCNDYRKFINQPKYKSDQKGGGFTAQSKLHSTILEQFFVYIISLSLKNIKVKSGSLNIGPADVYSNGYFSAESIAAFVGGKVDFVVNTKNQDLSVYKVGKLKLDLGGAKSGTEVNLSIPVFSCEMKKYLDKTMLDSTIASAHKIKSGNPYCRFSVIVETYEVDQGVDPTGTGIDQIYILCGLKSQTGGDFKVRVVEKIYRDALAHFEATWGDVMKRIEEGFLIP